MASLVLTYILWLVGGVFGLHHLYLGRVNQAIVWFATLGGGLGLGCLRDLWRIPYYVRWRNGEIECQREHLSRIALNQRPSCGVIRAMGMFVMGYLACMCFVRLLPPTSRMKHADVEIPDVDISSYINRLCSIESLLILAGTSFGVYVVGNIGEMKCSFFYPMIGSLVGTPWLEISEKNAVWFIALSMIVTSQFALRWRPGPRTGSDKNIQFFLLATSLWCIVLYCGVYSHAQITLTSGERIPLHTAVNYIFAPKAWTYVDSFCSILVAFWNYGWVGALWETNYLFEMTEGMAKRMLGLEDGASQAMITKQCRVMSSKAHPDRQPTEAKILAEKMFLRIREACDFLKSHQHNRYR